MKEKNKEHHVFWTGGFDSTFHLVHLLRNGSDQVRPHYIIRHEESTGNEVDAMNNIRRALTRKYPDWRSRLLSTIYINEDLIPRSEDIALEIENLKKQVHVHEQLHIMADYCHSAGLEQIDITYERDEHLEPGCLKVSHFFQVNPAFKSFYNAHEQLTKKACYEQAVSEGWDELLKLTSFCRRPRKKGRPCGTCGPCCDAVKEGLAFRLPFIPRMKARLLIPFRQFYRRNYLKHDSNWFFRWVKRKFEYRM